MITGVRFSALVVAAALFLVTGAVNLQVPLYQAYAEAAGYGNGLTAVVFAAYVAGLLPVLILIGGVSDRVGRKPVVLVGLLSAVLASVLVAASPTIQALLFARVLQGIGVGLSVGAGTAYLAEILGGPEGPTRAASYVAATTSVGFGTGALLTTGSLFYEGRTLVPTSYFMLPALALVCAALVAVLPPARRSAGGRVLRLPHYPPGTVVVGATIALAWAVTGLVIAVVPAQLMRYDLAAWAGPALFLVNGTGALLQPVARRMAPRLALRVGFVLLPSGYAVLILGAWLGALGLVLAGAAIAGAACYGFTYLGGLAEVSRAGGEQRARAVSGYFLFAYLGFGLPSVLIGFAADGVGVLGALVGSGAVVLAGSCALAFVLKPGKSTVSPD